MKGQFENAQQLHKENPETFEVPSAEDLAKLKSQDLVKICSGGERFWVMIIARSGNHFRGIIDNDLVNTHIHGYKNEDFVEFNYENIYKIYE